MKAETEFYRRALGMKSAAPEEVTAAVDRFNANHAERRLAAVERIANRIAAAIEREEAERAAARAKASAEGAAKLRAADGPKVHGPASIHAILGNVYVSR